MLNLTQDLVEKMAGLKPFTMAECRLMAKEILHNTWDHGDGKLAEFELVGPLGRKKCKWLDPGLGFFEIEGMNGCFMDRDFELMPHIHCENIKVPGDTKPKAEENVGNNQSLPAE
jgi:hypothetical protein